VDHRVCPWWLGPLLANPLRKLVQDPRRILSPFVSAGMTALEPGPGMGFFTLELARLVGPRGRVVAVDVQPRMLDGLRRRAGRAGVLDRVDLRIAPPSGLGVADLAGRVGFVLAFAMVHELADPAAFFSEAAAALAAGGRLLLAEPGGHVSEQAFAATLRAASLAGLRSQAGPVVWRSRTALLVRE